MPHMNVLDLSVFPCMSRRHTEACRETGGSKVLSVDEIWENAEKIWRDLRNCNIASAYIQAHRIASKVIREKGNNSFCGAGGDLHCKILVLRYFYNFKRGILKSIPRPFEALYALDWPAASPFEQSNG
jgi:hypothetical protein